MSVVIISELIWENLSKCQDGFYVHPDVTTYQIWFSSEKVREIGGVSPFAHKVIPLIYERAAGKIEKIKSYTFANDMVRLTIVLSYPETIASFNAVEVNEMVKQSLHDVCVRIAS